MKVFIHSQTATAALLKVWEWMSNFKFHLALYNVCNYLSILGSRLIQVSKPHHSNVRACIRNHIGCFLWDVITYSCPKFNDSLLSLIWNYVMYKLLYPAFRMEVFTCIRPHLTAGSDFFLSKETREVTTIDNVPCCPPKVGEVILNRYCRIIIILIRFQALSLVEANTTDVVHVSDLRALVILSKWYTWWCNSIAILFTSLLQVVFNHLPVLDYLTLSNANLISARWCSIYSENIK